MQDPSTASCAMPGRFKRSQSSRTCAVSARRTSASSLLQSANAGPSCRVLRRTKVQCLERQELICLSFCEEADAQFGKQSSE